MSEELPTQPDPSESPEKSASAPAAGFSIRTILPNLVTLLAFVSGVTAIRFGLAGKWDLAITAILVAGVLDALDGTVARLLRSTSRFGAELDSLSDIVAFGLAPAIVVYLWSLDGLDRLGWAISTLYSIAMALRLARFNSRLDAQEDQHKRLGYLTGVPAPAGAGLLLSPIMLDDIAPGLALDTFPVFVGIYTVLISLLMISTIPTIGLKGLRVSKQLLTPLMLFLGMMIAGLFVNAWVVCLIIAVGYLASMPPVYLAYRKRLRQKAWKAD